MILHIILIAMAIISGIIGIILILINYLYEYCSENTEAIITQVISDNKYFDSTYEKQLAFDYIYEYTDIYGKTHTGKIIKNSPVTEFAKGDKLSVRYMKCFPGFSLYRKIPIIPFSVLVMSIILFALEIFLFKRNG